MVMESIAVPLNSSILEIEKTILLNFNLKLKFVNY